MDTFTLIKIRRYFRAFYIHETRKDNLAVATTANAYAPAASNTIINVSVLKYFMAMFNLCFESTELSKFYLP